jgi:zinc finger SWIM domain-containing protein 3
MILFDLVEHFDHCLSWLRRNEVSLDAEALNSEPCLEPDASIIEKEATKLITPKVFAMVQFSIKAVNNCFLIEILDGDNTSELLLARRIKETNNTMWNVSYVLKAI